MQWDVLNLLVILYSSDIQYSFAYLTVKTKAYSVIISRIVHLWLLFKNFISFCLNSIVEQYNIIANFWSFLWATRYYTLTLISRLRITRGHRKRNHWISHTQLAISRVIWCWILSWPWNMGQVNDHSRSLKVVPFESLGRFPIRLP